MGGKEQETVEVFEISFKSTAMTSHNKGLERSNFYEQEEVVSFYATGPRRGKTSLDLTKQQNPGQLKFALLRKKALVSKVMQNLILIDARCTVSPAP